MFPKCKPSQQPKSVHIKWPLKPKALKEIYQRQLCHEWIKFDSKFTKFGD